MRKRETFAYVIRHHLHTTICQNRSDQLITQHMPLLYITNQVLINNTMTKPTSVAVAGGFLLGSLTTVFAYRYFLQSKKSNNKKTQDQNNNNNSSRRSNQQGILLSDLCSRLWVHLGVAIGDCVREAVQPMLEDAMNGLHFTKCDLGKVPIKFDNIVVHPIENDALKFDMDIVWDSTCDIELKAKMLKVGVRNICLIGRMQFIMKPLSSVLPCVGTVQYGFINIPKLDIDFTGIANIADFAVLENKIQNILDGIIASVMVLPNRLMFKMDAGSDYREAFVPPIGIARITAVSGRGFQVQKVLIGKDDIPDVYLNIQLSTEKVFTTSVQKNNLEPEWNETADFLLSDTDQILK